MYPSRNNHLILLVLLLIGSSQASTHFKFIVKETWSEKLCSSKKILTVNDQFPGPTLYVNRGDTVFVDVYNDGDHNITIHWHGVKQPRNPWTDGPEYITQCPIQPGNMFRQKVIFSDEEGTLWWHAHSDWSRATVHGMIIIYPKPGTNYPFPQPYKEVPIIIGEWWKDDVKYVLEQVVANGGPPIDSDAFTINGRPGDLYPCSKNDTFQLDVTYGKTYLLRIINAALNEILFFAIANHNLTVVGADGSYTKPLITYYIAISPGQTYDCLLHANQQPDEYYYMAARVYMSNAFVSYDHTTTTALIKYDENVSSFSSPVFPYIPIQNDTTAAFNFTGSIRSLANEAHPMNLPMKITRKLETTISINTLPCPSDNCTGPNGARLGASINNFSFVSPSSDILKAYYYHIKGAYGKLPETRSYKSGVNYTDYLPPLSMTLAEKGTRVITLEYNASVEMTFQNTDFFTSIDHPMHLHGYSFYVVGWGLGDFDKKKDPKNYNLVDPPKQNTIIVPKNGWTTIRFQANNPGVWYLHCHIERHMTWGMDTVLIVKDGKSPDTTLLSMPDDMPPC